MLFSWWEIRDVPTVPHTLSFTFIGSQMCERDGGFPLTCPSFVSVQVYFLWGHAKDVIQSFKTLER